MKEMSKEDKKFLEGIWSKARYLEYLKAEEELVKENCRRLRKRRIKSFITSILISMLLGFVIRITNFNFGVLWLLSIIILSMACFYENREERIEI
ncbi:hypothetical protein [Clostridium amazonitimonense]|uniref:hypothetical protein n=1 Tax=Clostridium amazonitimonense TaxID=1499689 RepID=UPI000509401C|nr:hypothetical protein [Clostridium amazonitimonense]